MSSILLLPTTIANNHIMVIIKVKPRYHIVLWYVNYIFKLFGRQPLMMDTVLPPFLTTGKHFVENTKSSRDKIIKHLFYQIRYNPNKAPLTGPFVRGYPHWIGPIHRYHAVGGANGSPSRRCLLLSLLIANGIFCTITTAGNLRGRSFFHSHPNP
jgi:hypothetical protein